MRLARDTMIAAIALAAATLTAAPATAQGGDAQKVRVGSLSGAYLAGRIAETDNELDTAVEFYSRALAFDANNEEIRRSLLLALIARGFFEEALPHAEKLKDVTDVERFSRLALGVDAIRSERYRQAEIYLKLALASDLDRLIAGILTGWARLGDGDADGALEHVDRLAGPEWYGLFKTFHMALIAEQAGLEDRAREYFQQTVDNLTASGATPDAYLRGADAFARFLARRGETEEARDVLDVAQEIAPGQVVIRHLRARIEAGEEIGPFIQGVREGAAEVLLNLASALNRGGGESFVRLYLQYARVLAPESDAILVQLAGVAEQQRKAEEAIALYRLIADDSPLKRVAEMQLGLNLADLERHDEAIEHLSALVEDDPDDMRAYLALGGVFASKQDFRSSADNYDRAIARIADPQPEHWNLFYQRGIAYERLKEWDKAEPNFHKALELNPDHPQVLNYLGYSWVDMNINLEEGLDLIRKAVDLRPRDGYIVDSLGWAYYRLGRFDEAVEALERAVSLRPEDPILNDHLGDAYWRVGRRLEATFQWRHARDLDPDDDVREAVLRKLVEGLPPLEEERAAAEPPAAPDEEEAPRAVASAAGAAAAAPRAPEEPAAAEEMPAAEPAVHVVRPGQSLWSIAAEWLGDGARYGEILELNPSLRGDPGRIRPGQELVLPSR